MDILLIITIFLPLAGAAVLWPLAALGRQAVRSTALAVTLLTLAATCLLVVNFPIDAGKYDRDGDGMVSTNEFPRENAGRFKALDSDRNGFLDPDEIRKGNDFAVANVRWLSDSRFDIRFSVGLDGLSLWLFALSSLLMVTSVLVSWEAIEDRPALFYAMLLVLECGCLGVFAARDIILFYVFFEFTLIPLFFLIGIWGSEQRRYAAVKFFLYTLSGSLLTFLGLLAIVLLNGRTSGSEVTFSIPELTRSMFAEPLAANYQVWIFLALFAGFAIKVPLFPLHTWLPLAHVQAPTAGSVILAGILLKIGTYGFVRFSVPMLPEATAIFMPYLLWLSVIGILYGALVALAQRDIKRLIAYSSVSHLGFCMLGIFAINFLGMQGGTLQMVNHGISTGALFAIVGMMYERYHTREIRNLGGLARRLPWLAFFMVLFTLSSIGLPGTNGFAGEFLLLIGMFQRAFAELPAAAAWQFRVIAVLSVSGLVLGAWYMLWLVQRVFFGPLNEPHHHDSDQEVRDMSLREIAALAPLAVFVLWIGLYPKFFLDRMSPALNEAVDPAKYAVELRYHDQAEDTDSTPPRARVVQRRLPSLQRGDTGPRRFGMKSTQVQDSHKELSQQLRPSLSSTSRNTQNKEQTSDR